MPGSQRETNRVQRLFWAFAQNFYHREILVGRPQVDPICLARVPQNRDCAAACFFRTA